MFPPLHLFDDNFTRQIHPDLPLCIAKGAVPESFNIENEQLGIGQNSRIKLAELLNRLLLERSYFRYKLRTQLTNDSIRNRPPPPTDPPPNNNSQPQLGYGPGPPYQGVQVLLPRAFVLWGETTSRAPRATVEPMAGGEPDATDQWTTTTAPFSRSTMTAVNDEMATRRLRSDATRGNPSLNKHPDFQIMLFIFILLFSY